MFMAAPADAAPILKNFGICPQIKGISELQRYHYERENPDSKEVRLIVKVELEEGAPLVMRFKNESGVTLELIESQSRFADEMRRGGIATPLQYQSDGAFAKWYTIGGYDVIVTVEQFVDNEIKVVDAVIAEKTGELLAKMHNISEEKDLHAQSSVLFDPFAKNDLFDFASFMSIESSLGQDEKALFDQIVQKYNALMNILSPLKAKKKYAVQGDISDCNLYQTCSGEIGIFDYNRCGDNNLFCDAIMQALFEARLMDYPDGAGDDIEAEILTAFLKGYRSVRSFSQEQQELYPHLYAIIDAFWSADIKWNEDSLINAAARGDTEGVRKWLVTIWERLTQFTR